MFSHLMSAVHSCDNCSYSFINCHMQIDGTMMPEMVIGDDGIEETFEESKTRRAATQTVRSHEGLETDWQKLLKQLYERIVTLEQQNRELSIAMANQHATITNLQTMIHHKEEEATVKNCDGIFIWKLESFCQQLQDMMSDQFKMVYSPGFYTNPNGYKICARLNVSPRNSKYLSIVLHMMKSENDNALDWPFHGLIHFTLIHPTVPGRSIKERAISSPDLEAFQKPICTLNRRSFGFTEFISLSDVTEYLHNDQLILRIEVKT